MAILLICRGWLRPGVPIWLLRTRSVRMVTSRRGSGFSNQIAAFVTVIMAKEEGPAHPQTTSNGQGSSDWALFKTVSNGIEGTGMPPSPLPEPDRWRLVAFVKSLAEGAKSRSDSLLSSRIAGIAPVHYESILASGQDPHQWLTYSGSYDGHRFSPDDHINVTNVSKLHLVWMHQYSFRNAD